jgi:iron-sulfur cluster assembly accessory protein
LILVVVALNYRDNAMAIGRDSAPARLKTDVTEGECDGTIDGATASDGATMTVNVSVTERAALRIGEILSREPAGTMLRVSVEGGGCSGFQYKFDTERAKADDDIVIERAGATVLIDPVSINYMAGSEIDFVDDLIGSSFKVHNPQATASCGCGTSFAL